MNNIDKMRRGQDILKWIQDGDLRAMVDEVVEMTYEWRQYKDRQLTNLESLFPHPAVVDVANRTGVNLSRFSVLQLGGAVIDSALSLLAFQAAPNFSGIIPTNPPDLARFAVMLDALPAGSGSAPYPTGRAVLAGAVACQVYVSDTSHGFAVPISGNVNALQSSSSRIGAVILTQPSGTGLQWLQVALGRCCADNFGIPLGGSSQPGTPCCSNDVLCFSIPGSTYAGGALASGVTLNRYAGSDGNYGAWSGFCNLCGFWVQSWCNASLAYDFLNGFPSVVLAISDDYTVVYKAGSPWTDCSSAQSLTLVRNTSGLSWPTTAQIVTGACAGGGVGGGIGGLDCCGSTEANVLASLGGSLAFLDPLLLPQFLGGTDIWEMTVDAGGCTGNVVRVECASSGPYVGQYVLVLVLKGGAPQTFPLTTESCSPLHLTGTGTISAVSPCTAGGAFTVDVTGST